MEIAEAWAARQPRLLHQCQRLPCLNIATCPAIKLAKMLEEARPLLC